MHPWMGRAWALGLAVSVLGLVACGGGGTSSQGSESPATSASGSASSGATTLSVTLQEFAILPAQTTVPAGSVTFEATNKGPAEEHEMVVLRTDLAPTALPSNTEGGADEEGAGVQAIGEIPEFPPGQTQSATFDLQPGHYVLICNIVDTNNGQTVSHYHQGMWVELTVSG
jgi:uncharacterized cupredoxin-like copper-binding protein